MKLQIKKRSLNNNLIDGSKVLFLNDDSFKKLKTDGSTQEVFSVSSENKVEFQIPVHVASDPSVDSEVANKHYVDLCVSQQGTDQSQVNDSLQSQIDSLPTPMQLEMVIDQAIIDVGYFELDDSIDSNAIMLVSDVGTVLLKGAEYTSSIVDGKTRVVFSADLLTGGEKAFEAGEKVYLFYFPISGTGGGGGSGGGISASDVVINSMSGSQTLMAPSVSVVKSYLISQLSVESLRAIAEETRIEAKLNQEISDSSTAIQAEEDRAISEETRIEAKISTEVSTERSRALSEEMRIETKVDQEISDRITAGLTEYNRALAAESDLQESIDAEVAAREAAETRLDSDIVSEQMAREAADTQINLNLVSETSDRQAADTALSTRLDTLSQDVATGFAQELEARNQAVVSLDTRLDALELDPVTKAYVDSQDTNVLSSIGDKVQKTGDTMTGALTLYGAPTSNLHAATKAYADSLVVPAGTILPYGGTSAPSGYLLCDGSEVSKTSYATLYSAIGNNFGSTVNNKFKLPDLRGQFLRGVGTNGSDPNYNTRTIVNKYSYMGVYGTGTVPGLTAPKAAAWSESLQKAIIISATSVYVANTPPGTQNLSFTGYDNKFTQTVTDVIWVEELSKFIAVCTGSGSSTNFYRSADGITWDVSSMPILESISSVAWSPTLNLLVAVSSQGSNVFFTSADGIIWTQRAMNTNYVFNSVTWSPHLSKFVAVGIAQTQTGFSGTSSDGIVWSILSGSDRGGYAIAWSEELKIFVSTYAALFASNPGSVYRQKYSYDGVTWLSGVERDQNPGTPSIIYDVKWIPELSSFIASCHDSNSTNGNTMLYSRDGINWWYSFGPSPSFGADVLLYVPFPYMISVISGTNWYGGLWSFGTGAYFNRYSTIIQDAVEYSSLPGSRQAGEYGSHNHGGGYHEHYVTAHNHGGGNHAHTIGGHTNASGGGASSAYATLANAGVGSNNKTSYTSGNTIATQAPAAGSPVIFDAYGTALYGNPISYNGGSETRPVNVYVNYIIKY